MGLDHVIYKLKAKVDTEEEYYLFMRNSKDIIKLSRDEIIQTVHSNWEDNSNIQQFICDMLRELHPTHYNKYSEPPYIMSKQDIIAILRKVTTLCNTEEGRYTLLGETYEPIKDVHLKNGDTKKLSHVVSCYSKEWWERNLIKVLNDVLQETDFKKETILYDYSY